MLRGKDHAGFACEVGPLAETVFLPKLPHPRAIAVEDLQESFAETGARIVPCSSTGDALEKAKAAAVNGNKTVVVTGSLSLVGEALAWSGRI